MSGATPEPQQAGLLGMWRRYVSVSRPASALITLRFLFFTLLAYDLWWIGLSHAPRYGAGGFHVPHLSLLSLSPSPSSIGVLYLSGGLLSLLAALGLGGRFTIALIALIYNVAYLWSQADSYQHHYLLGLLLLWFSWAPLSRAKSAPEAQRHPGYDALYVQIAIIYFWTAVAKTEPVWLSGEVIDGVLRDAEVRREVLSWGGALGLDSSGTFKLVAWGVMFGEYLAPLLFLLRPLRWLGFLMIPWFHISVEWVGFEIELFSYYMIVVVICLLSPARLWSPLEWLMQRGSEGLTWLEERRYPGIQPLLKEGFPAYALIAKASWGGLCVIILIACARELGRLPVEGAEQAGLIAASLAALCLVVSHRSLGLRLGLSFLLIGAVTLWSGQQLRSGDFGFDYYRMWGGDLSRRGELERAVEVYQRANELKPEGPARHAALGSALLKLGRATEAASAYEEDVYRWAQFASAERESGRVSQRTIRGLTRAYEGWARAYELSGQAGAALIRQQLAAELRELSR